MRPPRVFQYNDKFYTLINNELYDIDTKLKDLNKIQEKITKKLHVYDKLPPVEKPFIRGVGWGHITKPISNFDIEKIMLRFKAYDHGFKGIVSSDTIDTIKISPNNQKLYEPFSFIVNTDSSNKSGRHWIAVYIDPIYEKELDIFDSLGDSIDTDKEFQDNFLVGLKKLVDKMKLPYMLKMKMNLFQQQPDLDYISGNPSATCGYYAIKFILDRIRGITFDKAANLDEINLIDIKENEINSFKNKIKQLNYI